MFWSININLEKKYVLSKASNYQSNHYRLRIIQIDQNRLSVFKSPLSPPFLLLYEHNSSQKHFDSMENNRGAKLDIDVIYIWYHYSQIAM